MTKKERVLAVMKKEQVDMIPAGFWFHYKSDYTAAWIPTYSPPWTAAVIRTVFPG